MSVKVSPKISNVGPFDNLELFRYENHIKEKGITVEYNKRNSDGKSLGLCGQINF